ncbi:MAG: PEP-CTERM/exosortase system-associated acyltransferase [Stellaceae bacterium]
MSDSADPNFAWQYDEYFDIVRADNPDRLDRVYRLRYQVYCLEHPFENAAEHSDGRERDEDDDRSVHTLLVHRQTGADAGTARAILPKDVQRRPLPIQRILASQNGSLTNCFPAHSTAEISRFAVSKEFRRRRGEERYADANVPGDAPATPTERQMIPYITFGLIRGIIEVCHEHGISHISAVMEPALIRILGRFGLHFEAIGALVEYHGVRQPCVARIADLVERNRAEGTLLWQYTGKYAAGL